MKEGLGDVERRHRINAAKSVVEARIDFFNRQFAAVASEWKEDNSRVTFADFAISEQINRELTQHFPADEFCSEESNPADEVMTLSERFAWVLDPIDGTNNYALGFPNCAISLALLEEGIPVYGVVYDFAGRRLLHGGPGLGLFEGNRKIKTPDPGLQEGSLIGLSFPLTDDERKRVLPMLSRYRIRSIGSSTMIAVYTALGLLSGAIDFRVKVWDIAAGHAMAIEAGREFCFQNEPAFPLKTFHPGLPCSPYFAGTPAFCREVEELCF